MSSVLRYSKYDGLNRDTLPPIYFAGLGADDRYIPSPSEIKSTPTPGAWYRIKKGETWWGTAKNAYGSSNLKKGLLLMNAATWNDHIDRKTKGWEAYKVAGLQATPDYSAANPHAGKGSGSDYPTAWIPPLTGEEPEDMGYGAAPVTAPVTSPGTQIPGPPGPEGPKGDPGPPPSSADIDASVKKYLTANPPPSGAPGAPGAPGKQGIKGDPGAPGDPGPPPSSSDIQIAVEKYFAKNPPSTVTGPKGDPGPPPSSADIDASVQKYLTANPPPAGPQGPKGDPGPPGTTAAVSGGGSNMWAVPMAALLVSFLR